MTFFLDNCIPPPIGKGLRGFGADVRILREEFDAAARDIDWMPSVAQNGWIVITTDDRIRRNPAERQLLRDLKLRVVFLAAGHAVLPLWQQAAKIVTRWPDIVKACERLKPGTCLIVPMKGKIEVVEKL